MVSPTVNTSHVSRPVERIRPIVQIQVENIIRDENQPRKNFSNIEELSASIKEKGQLTPIHVFKLENGKYKIIDGERRWKAIEKINASISDPVEKIKVNAFYLEKDDPIANIIINIARENYTPMEMALALEKNKENT